MKNGLCLIHHQGVGDHIECNGMVRHFAELYDTVTIFVREKYYALVSTLYKDNEKILIHQISNDLQQHYKDIDNFIAGASGDVRLVGYHAYEANLPLFNQNKWGPAESFYNLAEVPFKYRQEKFYLQRDLEKEKETLESLNPDNEDFIFVHDDPSRGFELEIKTPLKIIRNDPTKDFFSMLGVITKATEIHCMSSSYFCLIDCMDNSDFVGKKYLHTSVRGVELFDSGVQGEWEIV